jgi:lipoyl(octanoyl) transferase
VSRPPLAVLDLGHAAYLPTLELQRVLVELRRSQALDHDLLLLVEHEPVVTLGRGTRSSSLPLEPAELQRRGVPVIEIERGGDVTWHGPGQLVGYPILDLNLHRPDLHWYLRTIEESLIGALASLGIAAGREAGRTGVWTRGRKIASIGVHVRRWITFHGFALNVQPDLRAFDLIVPCGIEGVEMTSIVRELGLADRGAGLEPEAAYLGPAALWAASRAAVVTAFARAFDREPVAAAPPLLDLIGRAEPAAG